MAFVSRLPLLLLSCIICHALIASAAGEQSYKILSTSSLKPQAVCSEPKGIPSSSSGATVPLNHRHGPCSPAPTKKEPTFEERLRRDTLRAGYVQRKFSRNHRGGGVLQSEAVKVPTELGSPQDTLEYVITVGVGSPAVQQIMTIDTGSDVSWLRCNSNSTAGTMPFDPTKSTTYTAFPCGAAACAQLGHRQGFPVRLQPRRGGVRRQDRRAHGARRRRAVARLADRGDVRQGLLLLPPGFLRLQGVPDARRGDQHDGLRDDGDAQKPTVPDVLRRAPPGHQSRRGAAQRGALRLLRRVRDGLRDHHHAAAAHGVHGAQDGVQGRHEAVPDGAGQEHPGHVLRLQRPGQRHHTHRRFGVRRRQGRRPRRQRDHIRQLPRVHGHRRRRKHRHHRQRAAEDP
uniref:Predicted protein n=1 Tax=Hordeum vulgare subsp. vulgare TaxID=112509 RepID=F2CQZ7_HORVV|nr:predicted protein [Hordeum vulgare subsp. vulgare]